MKALPARRALIRAGSPVGRLRTCPSCRTEHHAGTTCLFPTASGSHPGAAPASPLGTGVRVASERLPAPAGG